MMLHLTPSPSTSRRHRAVRRGAALQRVAIALLLVSAGRAAEAATELTVLLDWFVNPDHAALVIAKERGFFADADLEVTLVEPADPSLPPRLVAAGKADVAVTYQPQLHVQVAEGLPLTRFATLVATPLNSLVALADGPIDSVADLAGRKVGFSLGGFEDTLLDSMLESHGLSLDDVELVNVNFSLSPSLLSGQVDAVIGAYRNFELNQLDIEGRPGVAFYPEEEGVPLYDELILVAHAETLDEAALARFVTAIERAVTFVVNHPDEAWESFRASDPEALDDELNRRAWRDTLPRLALRPGALDRRRYVAFADYLETRGLIDETPALEGYAIELR